MRKLLLGLIGLLFAIPGFAACPSGQVEQTYTSATGTVTQNGTPSPDNPIEPVFYQQGNMVLRKVGNIADSYDATTGKITRRVGVKVFNGDEEWNTYTTGAQRGYYIGVAANIGIKQGVSLQNQGILSSHFNYYKWTDNTTAMPTNSIGLNTNASSGSTTNGDMTIKPDMSAFPTIETWKTWLSQNPITVYYQLATETTEDWNETAYCITPIKIATTAYNSARFSPVVTELNDTIATIRNVVTNTINQTKAIADLQATKQTRPDENCPAGKKCLLVEDNAGQPHWYEIIESAPGIVPAGSGYTQVEYLQTDGYSYIDTGIVPDNIDNIVVDFQFSATTPTSQAIVASWNNSNPGAYNYIGMHNVWQGFGENWGSGYDHTKFNMVADTNRHVWSVDLTNHKFYLDGNLKVTQSSGYNSPNTLKIATTGFASIGRTYGKYYSVQFSKEGSLVADFVPARRNSDGVLGVYDAVSGTFFTNAGTGTFTAAPEI